MPGVQRLSYTAQQPQEALHQGGGALERSGVDLAYRTVCVLKLCYQRSKIIESGRVKNANAQALACGKAPRPTAHQGEVPLNIVAWIWSAEHATAAGIPIEHGNLSLYVMVW